MGKTRPAYPRAYREEAVRLVRESGKSIGQIAKDLGIADQSLRNWVRQADLDTGRRTDGLTTEERDELRRLRRENRVLREEREILKKVRHAAYVRHQRKDESGRRGTGKPSAPVELRPTPLGAASPQKSLTPVTVWHHKMLLPFGKHAG